MKRLIYIVLVIIFLLLVIQPARDPDMGWHLRYGQYFFQTGHVLRDNIISYVWPQYKWVQASWGYDLIVYQIFSHFGFLGLSVAAGLSTFLTFLIVTWPQKRLRLPYLISVGVIFIALSGPMWGGGFRTQTPSAIFMAVAFVVSDMILNPQGRKTPLRWIWTLPIFFLVWANLHGGFALGLILLSIHWMCAGIVAKIQKIPIWQYKRYGMALIASWITPLVNPWGFRIYEETFKHTSNINLVGISEWAPLIKTPYEAVIMGIAVLITVVILLWNKKIRAIPTLIVLLVATYLAYSATRFVVIVALLVAYHLAQELPLVRSRLFQKNIVQWIIAGILLALMVFDMVTFRTNFSIPDSNVLTFTWNDYCIITFNCSEDLTAVMLKDPPKGHGFHPYNYGGYLSWRVPQVKTFIDGRMAAWEENGQTPPVLEGDWIAMPLGPVAFIKYDTQYHFQWVIAPTKSDIYRYLESLSESGQWTLKYTDDRYGYFVKLR